MKKQSKPIPATHEKLEALARRKAPPALRVRTGVRAGAVGPCDSPRARK